MAQVPGDLRVPGYLSDDPANQRVAPPADNLAASDPSLAFRNVPGSPYQGPVGGAPQIGGGAHAKGGFTYGFYAGADVTYTDNALLANTVAGGEGDDVLVTTSAGVRVGYTLTEGSRLDMNVGVTYRYSLNYRSFTQFNLVPNSFLNYRFLLGDVLFTFYDTTGSSAMNRPEIAGGGSAASVNLNRVSNTLGMTASWIPIADISVSGGYSYMLDRGLSDNFGILDQDVHSLNLGVYDRLGPYWTVGVSGGMAFSSFVQNFQNNSTTYSAGPMVSFTPGRHVTIVGSVRYQISDFSGGGAVNDNRNFGGIVWNLSAHQALTEHISHGITVGSGVTTGLGSNYTESFSVGYNFGWQFMAKMGLNAMFTYTDVKQSGVSSGLFVFQGPNGLVAVPVSVSRNDRATLYDFTVGTGYQITSRIRASLGYTYRLRDSDFQTRGYSANMVTVGVGMNF